ncbi:hypothetical protein [Arthrobacter sp. MYb213]|uniref:hypothetical protein n=1 Tax=Arthrobacter sp. MYb213 TaxID=1848595 RepID=UPI000CFB6CE7|nr:hypothetical protein [Arthrobacter sp. MYb213]PRB69493.1 hypothetical protein CQ011_12080 [Arthrobacter sp. MYb213]
MSAELILRLASRRMWLLWAPLIGFALLVSGITAQFSNGVSGLTAIIAGALVLVACLDWFSAETAANRATRRTPAS